VKCDPTVETLDLFHLVDEPLLLGFQSGLLRVDNSKRPSYTAVKTAIAAAGTCAKPHAWKHTTSVIGARAIWNLALKPTKQITFWSRVGTGEEATAQTGIFPASAASSPASIRQSLDGGTSTAVMQMGGLVSANSVRAFKFHGRSLAAGRYVFAALVKATMDPARTRLLISKPFTVR
jgi:hypothetical protein